MCIYSFKNICKWPVLLLIIFVTAKIKTELKEEGKVTQIKAEENVGGIKSKAVLKIGCCVSLIVLLKFGITCG